MTDQSYSTYQVAERLGVSVRRIQALVSIGLIKANKYGRDWVISEKEVERFRQQERLVGRPSKTKYKEEKTFHDHPSEAYLQVVEIIKTLVDKEGLGIAYRAFAEAVTILIEKEAMKGYRPKGRAHVCLNRLLGKGKCPDSYDHPCDSPDIPGEDHLSEWVQNGKTTKIVMQPYNLSYETMKEMVEYCEKRGLRADISAYSWHFPGKTLRVDITLNNKPENSSD